MSEELTCDELWYLYSRTYAEYKLSIIPTSTEFLKDLSDKLRKMHEDFVYPKEVES
ncbi:MAG: hypothetical protein GPJ51_12395 [Candidatus Heimdallarchaeota archaeon]|nr:hypothetical protein [Candidatus Heimdallarchaeota archaeon]